jgi:hypothetical protein
VQASVCPQLKKADIFPRLSMSICGSIDTLSAGRPHGSYDQIDDIHRFDSRDELLAPQTLRKAADVIHRVVRAWGNGCRWPVVLNHPPIPASRADGLMH